MLKTWSIKKQVGTGFVLLMILIALVGYSGYLCSKNISERNVRIVVIQNIINRLMEVRRFSDAAIAKNQSRVNQEQARILSLQNEIGKMKVVFRGSDDAKKVHAVEDGINLYAELLAQRNSAIQHGMGQTDLLKILNNISTVSRNLQEVCDSISEEERSAMSADLLFSEYRVMILTSIALLFAAISSFLVFKSISNSLTTVSRIANKISQGDLQNDYALGTTEFCFLGEALQSMADRITSVVTMTAEISCSIASQAQQFHLFTEQVYLHTEKYNDYLIKQMSQKEREQWMRDMGSYPSESGRKVSVDVIEMEDKTRRAMQLANNMNLVAEQLMMVAEKFKVEDDRLGIVKAKAANMIFISKIKAYLDGSSKLDISHLPSHKNCIFGQWLQNNSDLCIHNKIRIEGIDQPHQLLHKLALDAVQAFEQGDKKLAAHYSNLMLSNSRQLLGTLDQLLQNIRIYGGRQ